jgi:hypothetical protein
LFAFIEKEDQEDIYIKKVIIIIIIIIITSRAPPPPPVKSRRRIHQKEVLKEVEDNTCLVHE